MPSYRNRRSLRVEVNLLNASGGDRERTASLPNFPTEIVLDAASQFLYVGRMSEKKSPDRHVDPPMITYNLRIEKASLEQIRKIAKKEDRTRQALIREAVKLYLEQREA